LTDALALALQKHPGVRVLFTGLAEYERHAEGLGEFLPLPVRTADVVEAAKRLTPTANEDSA
jgi:hypothetical protein